MIRMMYVLWFLFVLVSCKPELNTTGLKSAKPEHQSAIALSEIKPIFEDGDINVLIEIPAGSSEKWELNKERGLIERDIENGRPRTINYLAYPVNYGMVPQTLLPKEKGGDGDPLDVLVIGAAIPRGQMAKAKLIGVLRLLDEGEQDDKLISIAEHSPLYAINSMESMENNYPAVLEILKLWFINYKGAGKMEFKGFGDQELAQEILEMAMEQ